MSLAIQDRLLAAMLSSLSIVASFGLAFAWNLERPFWAGFTAMVISLSTIGQTAQKALLRIAGTVAGAVVGLSLMALADQRHWILLTMLFLHTAIMIASTISTRYSSYFFYTSAVAAAIIVIGSIHNPISPFSFAMARIEETVLGIVVYSSLSLALWTRSSVDVLHKTTRQLVDIHQKIFQAYGEFLKDREKALVLDLYTQGIQCIKSCRNLLPAARMESYVVRRNRQYWMALFHYSHALLQSQNMFANLLRQMDSATLHALFPYLKEDVAALRVDVAQEIAVPEAGETLRMDKTMLRSLNLLDQQTARRLRYEYAQQVERARLLVQQLQMVTAEDAPPSTDLPQQTEPTQDFFTRRQVEQFFKGAVIYWSAILVWIYVNPPGTVQTTFAEMSIVVGLVGFLAGDLAPIQVIGSFFSGCLLAFCLYFGVMPLLHDFTELGVVLFCIIFAVTFRYYLPAHGLIRTGLLMPTFALAGLNDVRRFAPEFFFSGTLSLLSCATLVALVYYLFTGTPPARRFFLLQKRSFDLVARQLSLMTICASRPWWLRPLDVWRLRELRDLGQSLLDLSYALGTAADDAATQNLRLTALNAHLLSQQMYALNGFNEDPDARCALNRISGQLVSPHGNNDAMGTRIRRLRHFSQKLEEGMGLRDVSSEKTATHPMEEALDAPQWQKDVLSLCSALHNTVASAEKVSWEKLDVRRF